MPKVVNRRRIRCRTRSERRSSTAWALDTGAQGMRSTPELRATARAARTTPPWVTRRGLSGGQTRSEFLEVPGRRAGRAGGSTPHPGVGRRGRPPSRSTPPPPSGPVSSRAGRPSAMPKATLAQPRLETHLHAEALGDDAGRLLGPEQVARQHHRDAGALELTGRGHRLAPAPLGQPGRVLGLTLRQAHLVPHALSVAEEPDDRRRGMACGSHRTRAVRCRGPGLVDPAARVHAHTVR